MMTWYQSMRNVGCAARLMREQRCPFDLIPWRLRGQARWMMNAKRTMLSSTEIAAAMADILDRIPVILWLSP